MKGANSPSHNISHISTQNSYLVICFVHTQSNCHAFKSMPGQNATTWKNCCCSKRQQDHPQQGVELCTVRGSAKFFPCTQWTHLYHFVPTGTHLDTARLQKCQTCPHVEWSVHHVFLVSKKQFSCTYYLPRCLAIEVANIVMSSIYIPLIQMSKATNKSSGLFCCDDNRGVIPENYILV